VPTAEAQMPAALASHLRAELATVLELPALEGLSAVGAKPIQAALKFLNLKDFASGDLAAWSTLLAWTFIHRLGAAIETDDSSEQSRSWIDEWLLGKIIARSFEDLGLAENTAWRGVHLAKLLIGSECWCEPDLPAGELANQSLRSWLKEAEYQRFIGINRHQGILWFNKESFEELLRWLFLMATIENNSLQDNPDPTESITTCFEAIQKLLEAEQQSEYQVEKLLAAARS